jgi:hypothetical protein
MERFHVVLVIVDADSKDVDLVIEHRYSVGEQRFPTSP